MITRNIIKILPKSIRIRVENNYELRNIIGNINWLTFENLFKSLVNIFIFAWIARYLGPEQFGIMNYVLSFVALFSVLSTLGLDDIVIRNIISNPRDKEKYLGSTLLLKFIGSLLMLVSSVIVISIVEKGNIELIVFVLVISFGYLFKSFDAIDLWFKSQIQSQYSVYSRLISFIIVTVIKIILLLTQAPLVAFISMTTIDLILASMLLIYFYYKKNKISLFEWKIRLDIAKKLLKDSWPLILSGVSLMIEANIDQVMLKNIVGAGEVAMYSAALKLIAGFSFIPVVFRISFFPSIVAARKKGVKLYERKLYQTYQIMMIMSLFTAIPIILFGKFIVQVMYGSEYIAASILLQLMASRLFFTNYGVARGNFIINENLMKYSFLTMVIGAVVNVILNLIFIPKYQAMGAIIVSMISFFVSIFLIDMFYTKTRKNVFMMFKSMFNFYKLFIN